MIKICFITTISLTLKSFVLSTAKYLHDSGEFEIYMICNPDDSFAESLSTYVTYIPVKMKRGVGFDGLKVIRRLKKIFKEHKFDIVQYSTPNASCYASIAAKKAKVPVRLYCQWGIAYVGFRGLKRKLLKAIEKHTCKCSTWIEPDSKSNLEFAHEEKLYPRNVGSVIWNGSACGVDLKKFDYSMKMVFRNEIRNKYSLDSHAFVYGFVGRITRDKGVNELLEAFKNLNNGSYLMIVGPKDIEASINQELYQWSLKQHNVIYTGFTTEVEKYLSAMDCYILPSYREGFGMGVIEAQAMGVPVIVTNIPGPIDGMVCGKTGLIVDKGSVSGLVNAMKAIVYERDFEHNCVIHIKEHFDREIFLKKVYLDRMQLVRK